MEPMRYLRALRRTWWIVAIPLVLGLAVGWFFAPEKSNEVQRIIGYQATHTLVIDPETSATQPVNLAQAAFLVTRGEVPESIAEEFGFDSPLLVAGTFKTTVKGDVGSLEIRARADTPERAVGLADAAAAKLLEQLTASTRAEREAEQARLTKRLEELRAQIQEKQACVFLGPEAERPACQAELDALGGAITEANRQLQEQLALPPVKAGLVTLETAEAEARLSPKPPTPRSPIVNAAIFAAGGLLLGLGLVLLRTRLDTKLRSKEEAEAAFGVPVIAEIPNRARRDGTDVEIASFSHPHGRLTEAYRALYTTLLFTPVAETPSPGSKNGANLVTASSRALSPKTILVTSAAPAEGKSTTVANLAAVFAERGNKVLVLDCDYRRPRMHEYLRVASPVGMNGLDAELLTPEFVAELAQPSIIPGVSLISTTISETHVNNPGAVVRLQLQAIASAWNQFDVVLLDTAPILAVNDTAELLPVADMVLLTSFNGRTSRKAAGRTSELFARLGVPLAGVAFIATESVAGKAAYYYYSSSAARRVPAAGPDAPVPGPPTALLTARPQAPESTPATVPGSAPGPDVDS